MTGYGLIAAIPLFRKYKTAKAEYEALLEKQAGLQAAVASYNSGKLDSYLAYMAKDEPDNIYPEGVFVTTILRVGNCVGQLMRVHNAITFTNTSNKTYYIGKCYADSKIGDYPVMVYTAGSNPRQIEQVGYGKELAPGKSIDVYLPCGVSTLIDPTTGDGKMGYLRDLICKAAGKSLITSCPKISIIDAITSSIQFEWKTKEENVQHECYLNNKPGVLRYCGEAYYPKD